MLALFRLAKALATLLQAFFADERVAIGIIVALAVGTRFYQLGYESFWLDEATTFERSKMPLRELIADAEKSYHNPTYFLLIHYWMKLGDSEFMLRLPSAVFGILQVPVVYLLGRIAGGRAVAFGAALAICLNPKAVHYAQEARMYALYCCSASVAMTALVWLVANPGEAAARLWRRANEADARNPIAVLSARRAWIAFVLGCVVSLYCHATAVLFVVACSIVALAFLAVRPGERRGFLVNWVLVNALVILAFSPYIPSLFGQASSMDEKGFWVGDRSSDTLRSLLRATFLFGNRSNVFAGFIGLLALLGTFRLRKRPLVLAALWLLTVLGPGLLLLASQRQPMFLPRLFLWSVAPFAVLVGAGLFAFRWVIPNVALLFLFTGFGGYFLNKSYYATRIKPDWYEAINLVSERLKPGEKVLAIARRERRLLQYYFDRKSDPIRAFPYEEVRGTQEEKIEDLIGNARAIWTIQGRRWDRAEKIRAKLEARGRRGILRHYGGDIVVERYTIRSEKKRAE